MESNCVHRDRCRLCGGKDLACVVPLTPSPIADAYVSREHLHEPQESYPLDLYFCRSCAHLQLLDVVDPRLMFRNEYTYLSGSSPGIVQHFREYAASVLGRERPPDKSLVIDIGSNDGTFLRFFQEAGMQVLGLDPAAEVARRATAAGIETLPEFLHLEVARRVRRDRGPARIVTANNVFAHADDLAGMADSIRTLLAPDGLFVFEVSYVVDVVDQVLLGTIFHEHLCYHAVKPLRAFLARHGLELIDVERVTIQGGSLIGYAQSAGGPRTVSPRVADLIRMEEERGFDREDIYRQFSGRIERSRETLEALLRDLHAQGKVLAGFGAARGGTMMIAHFGLGKYLKFIVDDSPAKQGLFSPGDHLPVLPSEALYEQKPDYVFLLAWVHAKAILAKHRPYLDAGGRFILAFPKVEVVAADSRREIAGISGP